MLMDDVSTDAAMHAVLALVGNSFSASDVLGFGAVNDALLGGCETRDKEGVQIVLAPHKLQSKGRSHELVFVCRCDDEI